MHADDLAKPVAAGDACIDAQQTLLERLKRTGMLGTETATGLSARLDQPSAELRQAHHDLAEITDQAPKAPYSAREP